MSVFDQSYGNIQVVIIDDCSSDNSVAIIEEIIRDKTNVLFLKNKLNRGNCISFNRALAYAKGDYLVDFSTDDILLPEFIEKQVKLLDSKPKQVGVVFSDAFLIDEEGKVLKTHYKRDKAGGLLENVPEGDVYGNILERYFINPPTVIVRKAVLDEIGGYDEGLAFEDFDLWVRCSRKYLFAFNDAVLVMKRLHKSGLALKMNKPILQETIYRVILKAKWMNISESENLALIARVKYEQRQCFFSGNKGLVKKYSVLLKEQKGHNFYTVLLSGLADIGSFFSPVYLWYKRIRYGK